MKTPFASIFARNVLVGAIATTVVGAMIPLLCAARSAPVAENRWRVPLSW
jgi:hypothetical protein